MCRHPPAWPCQGAVGGLWVQAALSSDTRAGLALGWGLGGRNGAGAPMAGYTEHQGARAPHNTRESV